MPPCSLSEVRRGLDSVVTVRGQSGATKWMSSRFAPQTRGMQIDSGWSIYFITKYAGAFIKNCRLMHVGSCSERTTTTSGNMENEEGKYCHFFYSKPKLLRNFLIVIKMELPSTSSSSMSSSSMSSSN